MNDVSENNSKSEDSPVNESPGIRDSLRTVCVEKANFYHILQKGRREWRIGEIHFFGRDKNFFVGMYDKRVFSIKDEKKRRGYNINYVANSMVNYQKTKEKPNDLASFYHFDPNKTVEELTDTLNEYLILIREWIFEEVRKEFFPSLPSRHKCLWVIPYNKEALKYWLDVLGKEGKILKLELTGRLLRTNPQYLRLTTNSLDYIRTEAFKYWAGTSVGNPNEEDCLFEGFAKVIDIIAPESLGI
jgi:hypothetical protein